MLDYTEELGRISDIVTPIASAFSRKRTDDEFYRWKEEWQNLNVSMKQVALGLDGPVITTKPPQSHHSLTAHFRHVYAKALMTTPSVRECKLHLNNMCSVLKALRKMNEVLPFEKPEEETMTRLEPTKTLAYVSTNTFSDPAIDSLETMDQKTVDSLHKKTKRDYQPFRESEFEYWKKLSDGFMSAFHVKYRSHERTQPDEPVGFYILNKELREMQDTAADQWNILACGTGEMEGASMIVLQSILAHIHQSTVQALQWKVDEAHR